MRYTKHSIVVLLSGFLLSGMILGCGTDPPAGDNGGVDTEMDADQPDIDEPEPDVPDDEPEPDVPDDEPDMGLPELPPPLVEDRLIEVDGRTEMIRRQVTLPEDVVGQSPVFPSPAASTHGHVSVSGRIYGVTRTGELALRPAGWDAEASLGDVLAVSPDAQGAWLFSTSLGLLYEDEGLLWPSPVTDVIDSPIRDMLTETAISGQQAYWFASDRGLFYMVGDEIFHIGPEDQRLEQPVSQVALGPDPADPLGMAAWVAYGDKLYAMRPRGEQGLDVYQIDVGLAGPVLSLEADAEGTIWALTQERAYSRRPGSPLGAARWIRWELPQRRVGRSLSVGRDGAVWLLTDLTLYRTLDGFSWEAALAGSVDDIVAIAPAEQGSAWITRPGALSHAFANPPVAITGLGQGQAVDFMPNLLIYPALPDEAQEVQIRVDDCQAEVFAGGEFRYEVTGGGFIWGECLTPGPHQLIVEVSYGDAHPLARAAVDFDWSARPEVITWEQHVEPFHLTYCALNGCHVGGFAPDNYESWVQKADDVIDRITRPIDDPLRMPDNGAVLTDAEIRMIQWWRDDGLLLSAP